MRSQGASVQSTHVAFADESHYNIGRYRSVALVTLQQPYSGNIVSEVQGLLQESEITEFKWEKLRTAKVRFGALKLLDYAILKAINGILRFDVITWDTEDSRHAVRDRNDIANLQRMYYHLFKNVLRERWPDGSIWRLCPDEHTSMEWHKVEDFLDRASTEFEIEENLFAQKQWSVRLRQEFKIDQIVPCKSHEEPITQMADLFAGLAVYSRASYHCFEQWQCDVGHQAQLFEQEDKGLVSLSASDRERCLVLNEFDVQCKRQKLGVSLKTHRGLRTFDPANPINFWWYEPQHEKDKAPTK